jgi:hypothetical protein
MVLSADIPAAIGAVGPRLEEIRQASMNGGRPVTNQALKSITDSADTSCLRSHLEAGPQ